MLTGFMTLMAGAAVGVVVTVAVVATANMLRDWFWILNEVRKG
jgi:hypothetical protein